MKPLHSIHAQVTKDLCIGNVQSVEFWLLIEWTETGGKCIGQFSTHEAWQ